MLKQDIKEKDLVTKIGDENIIKAYLGEFDLQSRIHSPFRVDKNPSAGFFINDKGRIVFNDYGVDEQFNSVELVMKMFSLNYYEAIEKIANDFGLRGRNVKEFTPLERTIKPKAQAIIEIEVGKFAKEHLDYWEQFSISKKELEDNLIYYAKAVKINGFTYKLPSDNIRFAYIINYKEKQFAKIYCPTQPKDDKWKSNVTGKPLFGFNELPYASDTLIITKGQKDRVIFKKFFTDVVAVQNESGSAVTKDDAEYFNTKYKKVFINFDIDAQDDNGQVKYVGKESSKILCKKYGWHDLAIPEVCYTDYGIKDAADMAKKWGLKSILKWTKQKGLI